MGDHGAHIDRISDLPRNLIDVILQHLPIEDLVKTTILSRKWRYMWTSVPQLKFNSNFFSKCEDLGCLETYVTVTKLLLLYDGPMHKFILEIPSNFPIQRKLFNEWILFLSRKGVKHLELVNLANLRRVPCQMPSHIFSCQELTYLKLHNFELSTSLDFGGFRNLVELRLYVIVFESDALESLMSGCPLLEKLIIFHCSGFQHVNVHAPTLKVFHVYDSEVIKSISLKHKHNLIELILSANTLVNNVEGGWVCDLLKGLLKIERLCLGRGYFKIFSAINPPVLLRSFNTLKYLELGDVNFDKVEERLFVISLLQSSPNLEELVIESKRDAVEPQVISKEFESIDCCFSRLQIVKLEVETEYKHALNLIRLVLAKASSLKVLSFKVGFGLSRSEAPILLGISRDLLRMKRASTAVEVIFFYEGLVE
ncbi:F-box/FBD/LRR-repeat protein At1g13570 [Cajanus cajan]|uniref:F-box/FBD/LRR-repeat protein At1g13570 n=1 Tax=Cajanus cajan TaxID=3821 RepID=UPI0010FB0F03|nr:F-box/FBD/LRR-repeat protein At1g13570 [Cajanus cajan]